ncbi:MAG: hypothetical protein WCC95_18400 [Candidatus Sulfotelmatobacter sp.]
MRDVVLVPCYERPEFTRLCLQYLSRARGIEDKEVCLFIDNHKGKDFSEIFEAQQPNLQLAADLFPNRYFASCQQAHASYGNSRNVVDALKFGYNIGAERVYLVEDDILVAPDFFSWHEAVLEEPNVFVSCSTALSKSAHFQINGPQAMDETYQDSAAYYLAEGPYSSHAVAFKRDNLGLLLRYLGMIDDWHSGWEQDLCTQRYLLSRGLRSAWPFMPRAYNIGWYSYHINTGRKFTGALAEQSAAIERVIKDSYALRDVSANNSAVTPLPEHWPVRLDPVRNVQRLR